MNRNLLMLLVLLLSSGSLWAQNVTVSGVIKDGQGQTLPMASVFIEGTTIGVLANVNGEYRIEMDKSNTLVFHFIGYKDQFFKVTNPAVKKDGNNYVLNVKLKSEATALKDVVVIGYGTQKEETLTSAVSSVSGVELRKMTIPNLSQAMSETMPGVFGSVKSGQPGKDDAKFTIRGISSYGNRDILVLIDGMQTAGGFEQLDAGEVESITVLKDAAALAPYGVLGANGVVLVTTRRGEQGAPTVTASMDVTTKMLDEYPPSLGGYDVIGLGNEANMNASSFNYLRSERFRNMYRMSDRDEILYPDVDWYRELVKPAGFEQHGRVNVSGGTRLVKYFTSLSYAHQGDIMNIDNVDGFYDPRFDFSKINFRTNLDFDITPTTRLSTDIAGRTENINEPNVALGASEFYNIFKFLNYSSPITFPKYYPAEFVAAHPDKFEPGYEGIRVPSMLYFTPSQTNPYEQLNYRGFRKDRRDIVDFNMNFKQDLGMLVDGLEFSAKFTYSTRYRYLKSYGNGINTYLYDADNDSWNRSDRTNYNSTRTNFHPSGGESFNAVNRNIYYEGKFSYLKSFGLHNVSALGVFNRTKKESNFSFPRYHEDWAFIGTYDYAERYMFKLSAGYNGSENFAPGKRFGFFPATAVAWNITKEEFMKDRFNWLNNFKVRYSYGITGSEGSGRFAYEGGWGSYNSGLTAVPRFGIPVGGYDPHYGELKLANPDATWEIAKKNNLGFDIELINSDLSIKVDLYNEYRSQIFVTRPSVTFYRPGIGAYRPFETDSRASISSAPVNLGEVKSKGIEIVPSYNHYFANGIMLNVNGYINIADNRVVVRADRAFAPEYQKNVDKPIGWNRGYESNGYLNSFEEAINAPEVRQNNQPGNYRWADFNADGKIDANDQVPMSGTSQPIATYSIGTGASYKGFDLRLRFFGKSDVYYAATGLYWYPNAEATKFEGKDFHLDRWSPTNTDAPFPAFTSNTGAQYLQHHSSNYVNAKYLRLQSVSLSYLIASRWVKHRLNISTMKVFVNGNNLYTWTDVPYGDPEGGNSFSGGLGNYPLVKRISLGLDINF